MIHCGFPDILYFTHLPHSSLFTSLPLPNESSLFPFPLSDPLYCAIPFSLSFSSVFIYLPLFLKRPLTQFPDQIICSLLIPSLLLPNFPILAIVPFYFLDFCSYKLHTHISRFGARSLQWEKICHMSFSVSITKLDVVFSSSIHVPTKSISSVHSMYVWHFHYPFIGCRIFKLPLCIDEPWTWLSKYTWGRVSGAYAEEQCS